MCNEYSEARELYYYINSQGKAVDLDYERHGISGNLLGITNKSSCSFDFSTNNRCTQGGTEYIFNTHRTYGYGCHYGCRYKYKATYSDGTATKHYETLPQTYGSFSQTLHGSTISFTCTGKDSCSTGYDVVGSTNVIVGKADRSDSTDGCSQGTNSDIETAPTDDYDKSIYSWDCDGSGGGKDGDESDSEPYKCESGSVCRSGDVVSVDAACAGVVTEECGGSKPYCHYSPLGDVACVRCSTHSDCGSSKYCHGQRDNRRCSSCTWTSWSCNNQGARVRYCRTGQNSDKTRRTELELCPTGQSCSNGQCITSCTSQADCSGATYCSACGTGSNWTTCSGTGSCQSCTWAAYYCDTKGRKGRNCKDSNDATRKNERSYCPTGQTCSGGQCS